MVMTAHAIKRSFQRGIGENLIRLALEWGFEATYNNVSIYFLSKSLLNKIARVGNLNYQNYSHGIKVVVEEDDNTILTVSWTTSQKFHK
ncbi:MAG TPA: hypothetical protein PK467_13510 [Candidatus Wallbacteria bacterium]|nr:hypothetical protein [Candidatus Wallbacteria bacterium]